MSFKITDFPNHVQAQIRRQLADSGGAPVLPTVAKPVRLSPAARADSPQAGRPRRVVVSIISLRRRTLDDDNWIGGCKHLRDAIAASLGVDDGDNRIRWQYLQIKSAGRPATIVIIERLC